MRMRFILRVEALIFLVVLALPGLGRGAPIVVGARANGGFGFPVDGPQAMVAGYGFATAGQSVVIQASGLIDINTSVSALVGPDGGTTARSNVIGPFGAGYTPLEEKLVDAGTPPPITDGSSIVLNLGALIGAFVPRAVVDDPSFQPFDEDLVPVGIDADALFLIGSGPFVFTAPGPGTLFLGINEPFVSNNAGAFDVSIQSVVPEPSSLVLALAGMAGLVAARRGRAPRTRPSVA